MRGLGQVRGGPEGGGGVWLIRTFLGCKYYACHCGLFGALVWQCVVVGGHVPFLLEAMHRSGGSSSLLLRVALLLSDSREYQALVHRVKVTIKSKKAG